MSTTTPAQKLPSTLGLPSAVQARLSWHPLAAAAADLFVTEFARSSERLTHQPMLLSSWGEQFTRRVGPGQRWQSLPLEFSSPASPRQERSQLTSAQAMAGTFARRTMAPAPSASTSGPSSTNANLSHPALLLAFLPPLRSIMAAKPALAPGSASFGEIGNRLPVASALAFAPRLVTSVRQSPRQEVRGGFSAQPSSFSTRPEAVRREAEPAASSGFDGGPPTAGKAAAKAVATNRTSNQTAIAELIERTVFPTTLPGLEFRMILPEQSPSSVDGKAKRSEASSTPPPSPTPPPAAAKPIDINVVADKVYQALMRRQQLERERKGFY